MKLLLLCMLPLLATANMYDMVFPTYIPSCPNGCAAWTHAGNASYQPVIDAMWVLGHAPADASNHCAMPAAKAGENECDCDDRNEVITDSFAGPWCFCVGSDQGVAQAAYCSAPKSIPEQINLQLASPSVVVASFVTYEAMSQDPPEAMFGKSEADMHPIKGVTHLYEAPADINRTYLLHYIKFDQLEPHETYYYKVKSAISSWSEVFKFRAPYADGITRVATYGDMGHSHYNNMGNLKDDCAAGTIDAIVHMGDHAYNLGMARMTRGDAYMNAFQPTLTGCPWMPIIGNHEAADGDNFNHYLNITWGEVYGNDPPVKSSATTPLGHLLTKGTLYAAGVHGTVPSNTSRYFSVDMGLLHMVGLDLNRLDPHQLEWLDADLKVANANRDSVPWIMVMSHFPIYHSSMEHHLDSSAYHFAGDESEEYPTSGHEFFPCDDPNDCVTVGDWRLGIGEALLPLLKKYSVDIYNAGHVHDYESTWPVCEAGIPCQKDYINPKGTVHICEGNGGVPGVAGTSTLKDCQDEAAYCRTHGTGGAYGRITAFNNTHLQYEHVQNNGGNVTDSFIIVKTA